MEPRMNIDKYLFRNIFSAVVLTILIGVAGEEVGS